MNDLNEVTSRSKWRREKQLIVKTLHGNGILAHKLDVMNHHYSADYKAIMASSCLAACLLIFSFGPQVL
jgi:hypothetical protein